MRMIWIFGRSQCGGMSKKERLKVAARHDYCPDACLSAVMRRSSAQLTKQRPYGVTKKHVGFDCPLERKRSSRRPRHEQERAQRERQHKRDMASAGHGSRSPLFVS